LTARRKVVEELLNGGVKNCIGVKKLGMEDIIQRVDRKINEGRKEEEVKEI
jgi:hypothetical protein